jgi:DNA polymerase III epsilon subunit family exonuclease
MPKHIEEIEFTIFDTETTGLDPFSGDRVVELAGLKVRGGERICEFDSLVNPGREISPGAFAVNRITAEMLKDAPDIQTVMPRFLDFSRGSYLCSYNIEFDLNFLNSELKIIGLPQISRQSCFDILTMARRLMPNQPRYSLWFIAGKLGVDSRQQHRAFSDVEMAWEVFSRLKDMCLRKGVTDFAAFSELLNGNPAYRDGPVSSKISRIEKAIELKLPLQIKYLSVKDAQITSRQVIPREIRQEAGKSYLVGFCCLKNEERMFKVDNIMEIEIVR